MGNCVFKGLGVAVQEEESMVKVVTSNGGIMELYAPITAECITNEFPGHAIFRSPRRAAAPLLHNEQLRAGQYYYLLPRTTTTNLSSSESTRTSSNITVGMAPYRMSADSQGMLKGRVSEPEVPPRYNSTGVWKVRLVITPDQLSDILSQEARTEELIDSMRAVAKCATGAPPSAAGSDQWSWKTGTSATA